MITTAAAEKFTWEKLQAVVKQFRGKVPVSRVGNFAGCHINIGWMAWHELSQDAEFLRRGWARSTPVIFDDKASIWIPALKAIITLVPEVAPPKIVVEDAPVQT